MKYTYLNEISKFWKPVDYIEPEKSKEEQEAEEVEYYTRISSEYAIENINQFFNPDNKIKSGDEFSIRLMFGGYYTYRSEDAYKHKSDFTTENESDTVEILSTTYYEMSDSIKTPEQIFSSILSAIIDTLVQADPEEVSYKTGVFYAIVESADGEYSDRIDIIRIMDMQNILTLKLPWFDTLWYPSEEISSITTNSIVFKYPSYIDTDLDIYKFMQRMNEKYRYMLKDDPDIENSTDTNILSSLTPDIDRYNSYNTEITQFLDFLKIIMSNHNITIGQILSIFDIHKINDKNNVKVIKIFFDEYFKRITNITNINNAFYYIEQYFNETTKIILNINTVYKVDSGHLCRDKGAMRVKPQEEVVLFQI